MRGLDSGPPKATPSDAPYRLVSDHGEHVLFEGTNVIGRGDHVTIRLDSSWASREHARIVVEAGCVTIEDLGSKNGTYLNGECVREPTALRHGDSIRIGRNASELRFVAVDEATLTERST